MAKVSELHSAQPHPPVLACRGGLMRGEPGRGEAVGERGWRSFSRRAAYGQRGEHQPGAT